MWKHQNRLSVAYNATKWLDQYFKTMWKVIRIYSL